MKKSIKHIIGFAIISLTLLTSCGTSSRSTSQTTRHNVNHYHHNHMNTGFGRPYHAPDIIIIPDIDYDIPVPVTLPEYDY